MNIEFTVSSRRETTLRPKPCGTEPHDLINISSQFIHSAASRPKFILWSHGMVQVAWPSGLGGWIWDLKVPCSNPPPQPYLGLVSVTPRSSPRPRWVNNQLVSLPSVGILNGLCSICNICLFYLLSPVSKTVLNLTNWRQFFMPLSCYWSWISSWISQCYDEIHCL